MLALALAVGHGASPSDRAKNIAPKTGPTCRQMAPNHFILRLNMVQQFLTRIWSMAPQSLNQTSSAAARCAFSFQLFPTTPQNGRTDPKMGVTRGAKKICCCFPERVHEARESPSASGCELINMLRVLNVSLRRGRSLFAHISRLLGGLDLKL